MAKVGRPELYPVKKLIGLDAATAAAIEAWCRAQPEPRPTASDAIRGAVREWLDRKAWELAMASPAAE